MWAVHGTVFRGHVDAVKSGRMQPDVRRAVDDEPEEPGRHEHTDPFQRSGSIAVIPISGLLTKHEHSYMDAVGGTSMARLRDAVRKAARDDSISSILLHIDSPGGTVAGTKDLADDVARANGIKPVHAFIEDMGCSAAYWIASQCRRVYLNNETGEVGSIGTLCLLYDTSGMYEKEGVVVYAFESGKFKGAGHDGVKIGEEQAEHFQALVEESNSHFIQAVSDGRGIPAETIQSYEARTFLGRSAVEARLVDKLASFDAAIREISQESYQMNEQQFKEFAASNPESEAVKSIHAQGFKAGKAEGTTDARGQMKAIAEACPNRPQLAIETFLRGHDAETAKHVAEAIDREASGREQELKSLREENERLKATDKSPSPLPVGHLASAASTPEDKLYEETKQYFASGAR